MTTYYALDLASPLSQILSDGTSQYVYGQDRLFGVASSTAPGMLAMRWAVSAKHAPDSFPVASHIARAWPYPLGFFDPTTP